MTNAAPITDKRLLFIASILLIATFAHAGNPAAASVRTASARSASTRTALARSASGRTAPDHTPLHDTSRTILSIDLPILAFMANNNVPGISLAVTRNGHLVYAKGYGFADR